MITGEQGARKPASPVREETGGKGPGQGHLAGGRLHAGGGSRETTGGNTGTAPARLPHLPPDHATSRVAAAVPARGGVEDRRDLDLAPPARRPAAPAGAPPEAELGGPGPSRGAARRDVVCPARAAISAGGSPEASHKDRAAWRRS